MDTAAEGVVDVDVEAVPPIWRAAMASSSGATLPSSRCCWLAASWVNSASNAAAGSRDREDPDGNLSVAASKPGANVKMFWNSRSCKGSATSRIWELPRTYRHVVWESHDKDRADDLLLAISLILSVRSRSAGSASTPSSALAVAFGRAWSMSIAHHCVLQQTNTGRNGRHACSAAVRSICLRRWRETWRTLAVGTYRPVGLTGRHAGPRRRWRRSVTAWTGSSASHHVHLVVYWVGGHSVLRWRNVLRHMRRR